MSEDKTSFLDNEPECDDIDIASHIGASGAVLSDLSLAESTNQSGSDLVSTARSVHDSCFLPEIL